MAEIKFDRYYRYDELTAVLEQLAEAYPDLMHVQSLGKSFEGRDIWLAVLTNFTTGADVDKPAFWVDGNIHATEVSPSTTCLNFIHLLLENYGSDEDVTRVLDTRTFYITPRVNPDGAEWALADKPRYIRSSTRPYPYDEAPLGGLWAEDLDGDGRILTMRIPDPNGAWKVYPDDPRLMVRRDPTEYGGTYYRLLPEGPVNDFDGVTYALQQKKERLDLNRNFPENWRQEYKQKGAGPYPTSEPEAKALVDFITKHPNITGGVAFHTYSGVLLRPYDDRSDEEFPAEDLWTYQKIGDKGTELTGYPNVSVYHDFRYHPKEVITGGFDAWLYEHMGVFAWTVEIWSPQRQAGIKEYKFIDWYREHPLEDDLTMLKWSDESLDSKGYVNWYPFEHPQLGQVELGGWDEIYAFRNPPRPYLEKEINLFPRWLIWSLLISPRLELFDLETKALGDDTYKIRMVVHNTGWLPSYVTKKALEKKVVRNLVSEITLPDGGELLTGRWREEHGQLEGRAYKAAFPDADDVTDDRVKIEWIVKAPAGSVVELTAKHQRAGTIREKVTLGA
ncbi:MAG: M14 family metallopeptidase [Anaerolineae bacterium]|nr:M14 family metallopeptidase [Anaerolineae bacterium]